MSRRFTLLRSDGARPSTARRRDNAAPVRGDDRRHGADRPDPVGVDPADAGRLRSTSTRRVTPFRDLGEFFELAGEADAGNEYAVAWIDQLASGNRAGRGLLMTGNHAAPWRTHAAARAGSRLAVPFQPPVNLLEPAVPEALQRRLSLAARARAKPRKRRPTRASSFRSTACGDWNRLYGPQGLYQHQSVVPEDDGARGDRRRCSTSRAGPGRARSSPCSSASARCARRASSRSRAPASR